MTAELSVKLLYGPDRWFREKCPSNSKSLLDVAYEQDEAQRTYKVEGHEPEKSKDDIVRYEVLFARSSDFASLSEHTITNFVGFIRRLNPETLVLQNPPERVARQLSRAFNVENEHFDYPVVTFETLRKFNENYGKKVIGQPKVKELLLSALYQLTHSEKTSPVVLMFYGPSGVGKTETAKFINDLLNGKLLRKQFSMYHNEKFASYLFGGTHSEPSFAHDLLDRESGVILIDEFDKANSVFHGAFYQFFDEGTYEDRNYRVEVGRSLIICTSNYSSPREIREALGDALYSRFDAFIQYEHLSSRDLRKVVRKIVSRCLKKLSSNERNILDEHEIESAILEYSQNGSGNVRQIIKMTEQLIALKLVRSMIEGGE